MTRAAAAACALLALACAGPRFELADLPASPVAVVYRTVEEADRVEDIMRQQVEEQRKARQGGRSRGSFEVRMEHLEQLAGWRGEADAIRDQLGRLALFVAPTSSLRVPGFAPRGARPLQWSSDRSRLLYAASVGKRQQLYEWHAERDEVRQVTRSRWDHIDGCYGPEGAVAFVQVERPKESAPTARIWVQRPGEAPRPLTAGPTDGAPTWSPRAERIVYVSLGPRQQELLHWVDPVSGDGGPLTQGRSPVFTPDGNWIVYSARTRGTWKLWRMHADGSGRFRFGDSPFHENDPSVSPDGLYVVYAGTKQERSAASRLFVRPLDGTPDRQLELAGSGLIPVW